jgi:hypothetical protein
VSQWLIDNHRWLIPVWFGGLMLITLVRWAFAERRNRRDKEWERWFIERIRRRRGEL